MKKAFTIFELPPSLKFRRASLIPNNNVKQGFTIVELLVVIVVIGILAAITIVSYTGISSRATTTSLQSDLTNGSKKLKMYQVEYGSYPATMTNDGSGNYCPSGSTPPDNRYCLKPSSSNAFTYISSSPYLTFSLSIINGNTSYSITNNTSPIPGGWIVGIVATALANKWVYNLSLKTPSSK